MSIDKVNLCCRDSVNGSDDIDRRIIDYVWTVDTEAYNILGFLATATANYINRDLNYLDILTPIFMNKMLALKFVLSIVSRHLIGQF
jgi:hypothetical protein